MESTAQIITGITPDHINTALSIASLSMTLLLGGFAIWLSVYFYNSSKNTEKDVSNALCEIKTQTGMLKDLNDKQLQRLTKFVTERPNVEYSHTKIEQVLEKIPDQLTSVVEDISDKQLQNLDKQNLLNELVRAYIALYFYTAQANYWAQFYLPKLDNYDPQNEFDKLIIRVIDASNQDFNLADNLLQKATTDEIEKTTLGHLYSETKDFWKDMVMSSTQAFKSKS